MPDENIRRTWDGQSNSPDHGGDWVWTPPARVRSGCPRKKIAADAATCSQTGAGAGESVKEQVLDPRICPGGGSVMDLDLLNDGTHE